ncbi:hypothetical protein MADP09_00772 [Mycoplasma anatis]|nr:hypothetical protein [Mycoplasmopsis anatis]
MARIAPSAIWSLATSIAVGTMPSFSICMVCWKPDMALQSPSRSAIGWIWLRVRYLCQPARRRRAETELNGPANSAICWWPNATRCSTPSRVPSSWEKIILLMGVWSETSRNNAGTLVQAASTAMASWSSSG